MSFSSFSFGIFLLIAFFIYYALPSQKRWAVLLCASIIFYMSYSLSHILILGVITLITYVSAIRIDVSDSTLSRKLWFAFALVSSTGLLIFFKYFNFFSVSITSITRMFLPDVQPVILQLLLPAGISFYTFQSLGYLIDVYKGQIHAERHFGIYAAFVSFFPQILSGPIGRGGRLLPQYHSSITFNYDDITYGLKLMAWGYFKKLAIADTYSLYVNKIYDSMQQYEGLSLFLATLMFTIQIYCDFSGYSDIAIGTARLFGIHLDINFKSPYFSSSVKEFWSRWHISLSQWFRDYVYIPLGGNRKGTFRTYANLLVTFLVSGLWHGANWTFVIWGALHGIGQIFEKLFHTNTRSSTTAGRVNRAFRTLLTFIFCSFAWAFFRANNVQDALYMFSHFIIGIAQPITYLRTAYGDLSLSWHTVFFLIIPMIPLALFDYYSLRLNVIEKISSLSLGKRWMIYICFVLFVVILLPAGSGHQFIYFQF